MSLLPFLMVNHVSEYYEFDRIFDFLNDGSFATVYKARRIGARDGLLANEDVALKIVQKKNLNSEKAVRDIINEVEILKRVKHPNCVMFHEVLQTPSEVILVLELVKNGGELFSAIVQTRQGVIAEATASTVAKQLFLALSYLHDQVRVVHRDLKPENVLVTGFGTENMRVVVVDFGLAKYYGSQRKRLRFFRSPVVSLNRSASVDSVDSVESHLNSPMLNTPCGTVKYAAPETIKGMLLSGSNPQEMKRGSLPKLDMYAAGIIVYVMLAGHLPYSAKNKSILSQQMESGVTFDDRWKSISEDAKNFIKGLLAADPEKRSSASDTLQHRWIRGTSPVQFEEFPLPQTTSYDDIVAHRHEFNHAFSAIVESQEGEASDHPPQVATNGFPRKVQSRVQSVPFKPVTSSYFSFVSQAEIRMDEN